MKAFKKDIFIFIVFLIDFSFIMLHPSTQVITTQNEHILYNNSHEFHIFWVVIMPKTLN